MKKLHYLIFFFSPLLAFPCLSYLLFCLFSFFLLPRSLYVINFSSSSLASSSFFSFIQYFLCPFMHLPSLPSSQYLPSHLSSSPFFPFPPPLPFLLSNLFYISFACQLPGSSLPLFFQPSSSPPLLLPSDLNGEREIERERERGSRQLAPT